MDNLLTSNTTYSVLHIFYSDRLRCVNLLTFLIKANKYMILMNIKYYQNMKIDIDSAAIGAYALSRNTTYCVSIPWKQD